MKNFKSRNRFTPSGNINITPLMDVLTTLLFFLVKTMTVSTVNMTTPEGLRLPASVLNVPAEEAVTVTIFKDEIMVDHQKVMEVVAGRNYHRADIGEDDRTLNPLYEKLMTSLVERNKIYDGLSDEEKAFIPPPKILIQADKELPFATLKYVLHTVAKAGHQDYQFLVINPN